MDIIVLALLAGAVGFVIWRMSKGEGSSEGVGGVPTFTDEELMKMKKDAIEEVGRNHGIELDRRMTKANMIKELRKQLP